LVLLLSHHCSQRTSFVFVLSRGLWGCRYLGVMMSGILEYYFDFTHIWMSVSNRLITSVRFEVFTAVKIHVAAVFWVMTSCSFIVVPTFQRNLLRHLRSRVKIEVVSSLETLVRTYQTTRCHNPQDRNRPMPDNVNCNQI
jgi:hypothetical protein